MLHSFQLPCEVGVKLPAFTTGYTEKRFVLFTHLSHRRRKKSRFSLSFSMETISTNATARDCSLPELTGEEVASESPPLAEESLAEELELRHVIQLVGHKDVLFFLFLVTRFSTCYLRIGYGLTSV
jgi:hypothetical protein